MLEQVVAVIAYLCVCLCLSDAGIVSKQLNVGSRKQRHVIVGTLVFWRQESLMDDPLSVIFAPKVTHPFSNRNASTE